MFNSTHNDMPNKYIINMDQGLKYPILRSFHLTVTVLYGLKRFVPVLRIIRVGKRNFPVVTKS
jgi:hypothetical protein